jgi:hypothetical protein
MPIGVFCAEIHEDLLGVPMKERPQIYQLSKKSQFSILNYGDQKESI